jgi:hypothetical protein
MKGDELLATDTKIIKSKAILRQAEVALRVPGRLSLRIIKTFSTTRVVGRQPNAPAAFTPGEIVGVWRYMLPNTDHAHNKHI